MKISIAAGVVLAVLGCSSPARNHQADATGAIQQIWTEYAASLTSGNADRWLALWTEDGVQMPPDEPALVGKQRIATKIRGILDQFRFDMSINNAEVHTAGDWAFARGTYRATLTPKRGGKPIPIDGKYMTILARQSDGSWKIHRDTFNSNVPPGR